MKAIGVLMILSSTLANAQSDEDALRYSMQTFGGTARYMGLSGAFGALGADFSSLSSNPAGIGLYRSSEFSITPALTDITTQSNYLGNSSKGSTLPFNISSFGFVFSNDLTKHGDNGWKRFNIGFGMNRLNDYNKETYFTGYNPDNSLSDYYVEQANQNGGVNPSQITATYPYGAGLFYQGYIIDPSPQDSTQYVSKIQGGDVQQTGTIDESGSQSEYVISFGANYDDHLLLGATMGLPSLHYHSDYTFTENDVNDVHDNFQNYTLYNHVTTNGFGINGKFGATYIFNNFFRAGIAVHTPTLYTMHDDYYSSISSVIGPGQSYNYNQIPGSYNYDLVTPFRLIGSVAGYFQKSGFIDVDYELVDYNSMKFKFNKAATPDELVIESQLNQSIKQKYRAASTVRLGGEYAADMFRLRLGAAYYQSPFENGEANGNNDFTRWSFSGGIGVRETHFYADFAYVRTISNEFYQPYTLSDQSVPGDAIKRGTNNFVLTLGTRF